LFRNGVRLTVEAPATSDTDQYVQSPALNGRDRAESWLPESFITRGGRIAVQVGAEVEARRRGCDRIAVSSFTFQAPGFYQRHGYVETGRTRGIPGGNEDVHMFKSLE